jgi:hypothetical protein
MDGQGPQRVLHRGRGDGDHAGLQTGAVSNW